MSKKKPKGSVWSAIKIAVGIFEASETLNTMNRSKWDEFVEEATAMFWMGTIIIALCGLWYVMVFVFHW